MHKFPVGSWVSANSGTRRGVVRGHHGQHTLVRWLGHKKARAELTRKLHDSSAPRALVLEGSMDPDLTSLRSEADLLRTWFTASLVPIAYKNIHALTDIPILTSDIRRNPPPFVHISCHGDHDEKKRAYITFAPKRIERNRIYLCDAETQRVFRDAFEGMPVFFSACLLGRYQKDLTEFRRAAGLSGVAGFTRSVDDSDSMIFELLLYQGVLFNHWTFRTAVRRALEAMEILKIHGGKGMAQKLVRVF
jgi:hypothetical protein